MNKTKDRDIMIYKPRATTIEQSFDKLEHRFDIFEKTIVVINQRGFRKTLYLPIGLMLFLTVSKIIDKF